MPLRLTTIVSLSLALTYSGFLFVIAAYLPYWTKRAAAALTWVVYARMVKSLMTFFTAVLCFAVFVQWPGLRKKWSFLLLLAVYCAMAAFMVARLGGSVNEYVHFPQYAALTLLWFAAFNCLDSEGRLPAFIPGQRPWAAALIVSGFLGLLEESFQKFLPLRVFDFQDILLNLMGVCLGGFLIWVVAGAQGK